MRLFLNAVILEFVQQRNVIDHAAKMNFLAYASGDYLDHIGALFGIERLDASSATCTVRFSLSAGLPYSTDIPAGTRITPDGKIYFAVAEDVHITAGQTEAECVCICTTPGTAGNDYVPGQIAKLVDPFPYEMECRNISTSSGGTDAESDDAFRERIHIAPESFTTAGTKKGYEYYALSADPDIASVSVLTADDGAGIPPGNIYIFVLMKDGIIPDASVLERVMAACSAEDVRPDTDYVHVMKPLQKEYEISAEYWIDAQDSSRSGIIQEQVEQAVREYMRWQGSSLGRDINPSRLSHDIIAAGAKRCEIISPEFAALSKNETAHTSAPFKLKFMGLE